MYRNNYLRALKAFSQNGIAGALVRALDFVQKYTAAVDFAELEVARLILKQTNAFSDANEAEAAAIRLLMPSSGLLESQGPAINLTRC